MDEAIEERMADTRRVLLEEFDEDVHERLRAQLDATRALLDAAGQRFWSLTKYVLGPDAVFNDDELCFSLLESPANDVRPGRYHLISKSARNEAGEFLYRLSHPLAEHVLSRGLSMPTPTAEVRFDVTGHQTKLAVVEELRSQKGWLVLDRLTIESLELEEHLVFTAVTDGGEVLDQDRCERLFRCEGAVGDAAELLAGVANRLAAESRRHAEATVTASFEANNRFFQQERDRLERWADDKVKAAEKELADVKAQIRASKREERLAETVDEHHRLQVRIKDLEKKQRRLRQRIFDVEDDIAEKRDELIAALEKRLAQNTQTERLYTIRWRVV